MRARKCDCCGCFYGHYDGAKKFKDRGKANGVLLIDRDLEEKYWKRDTYDLCPDCMEKLEAFLKCEAKSEE